MKTNLKRLKGEIQSGKNFILLAHLASEFHRLLIRRNEPQSNIFSSLLDCTQSQYEDRVLEGRFNERNPAHVAGLFKYDQSVVFSTTDSSLLSSEAPKASCRTSSR